jgi:hypothetical protein
VVRVYQYNKASVQVHVAADLLTQSDAVQKQAADYYQYLGFLIGPRRNVILLIAAGVAGLLTLRRRSMWPFVLWGVGILGLSLAWALNLGPFRPDHFAIVLFFPAAVFLADGLTSGAAALGKHSRAWVGWSVLAVAAGFLVAWGIRDTRDILNPVTIIATPADQQALNWVKANTEPTARFYINSVPWQGTTYRGVDGGYWLVPDTGRFSLVPPALYTWGTAEWVQQINQWAAESQKIQGCTPDFWKLVREAQLTHVYVTKGKGNLQADALLECPRLRPVYQQDDITIFEILTPK